MPTISINQKDFEQLLGRMFEPDQVEVWLQWVKGESKGWDGATGEWRIELQDSNRPDLWCCEGLARQIRTKLQGRAVPYPFFQRTGRISRTIRVAPGLEKVRPFVAACAALGAPITDEGLTQLIQTQEKLAEIYGRKRRTVSIGLYRLQPIIFPVDYTLEKPEEARFIPLGFEAPLALSEILTRHPKGLEYGSILADQDRLPLLQDQAGQVLSMPPIINSREIGEVQVGDRDLLVEVTGTNLLMVVLTLNILAVNLADRGARIEPIETIYPYATPLGKTLCTPLDFGKARSIPIKAIQAVLGGELGTNEVRDALASYGYHVTATPGKLTVKLPPYRNDLMHPVDVIEDVAISRGYGSFAPVMPSQFTMGGLSRVEEMSDRARDLIIGMGFQEIISNVLLSRSELVDRMRLQGSEWSRLIEVENVMAQTYACLRQWITPSLLRVEAASSRAFYPHRLFEVGEVVIPDLGEELGARMFIVLGALIAHANANFSEAQSVLDLLLFYLGWNYTLEPIVHPSFLEGRSGRIISGDQPLGLIGELHPEVLERWEVAMPVAVFELEIDSLLRVSDERSKPDQLGGL